MKRKITIFERMAREEIAKNIKTYMALRGKISQKKLSELTGIPASTIANYSNMSSTPAPEAVKKIAKALDVAPEDIDPRLVNIEEMKNVIQNSKQISNLEKRNFQNLLEYLQAL